jgi:CheY-like chemotaxis protein
VKDTGIGIPPEGMSRLFKSFSQVDASTTRRFGGTGLGLAISKRLAELMGGSMWAESTVGEGSTFYFTVTLGLAHAHESGASPRTNGEAVSIRDDVPLAERCPLRLLLVEDNPVNQRVANLLLERLGYRAVAVGNGSEACAAASAADYDVILMDIEMPELDGCEATRRIRAQCGSPTRPWIIALTAGASAENRERAMKAGMNDYLTKPARSEAISAALVRAHAALQTTAATA